MGYPRRPADVLPASLPPRGLSRTEAAAFIGVSPSLFDELVRDGRMPQPKLMNARVVWDRIRIERSFDALPDRAGVGVLPGDEDSWADFR